ncbi:MAG: ABC transporter ATP-binding protein [Saprospiraceae bacterium]|nr:ABC transporter ATP-binding protein [Saprospiraceae bacterium]
MTRIENQDAELRPMRRLFRYLGGYKKSVWFAVITSVINKIFDLMPPILTAWIIDIVAGQPPAWIGNLTGLTDRWSGVLFVIVLTAVVFGGESFFEWLFQREFMRLAQRVQHDLRMDAYGQLQSREMGFFENQRTGNLLSILNDDVNQLERFLNSSFSEIVHLITLVIFAGWALCAVSLPLGLLGMLPIPFIVWGSVFYQRKIAPHYKAVRDQVGHLNNRLENNISGILVIKSFATESYEEDRVRQVSAAYKSANFKAIRWSALYVPLIRILITVGFAGTLAIGAYWAIQDPSSFSLGSLAFFAMMIQRLLWPVTRLGSVFDAYERARASARRVFGLLDAPNTMTDLDSPKGLPEKVGTLDFEQVYFSYQKEFPILQGVDLHIGAGQRIGIAGITGAGKTTLIKLLLRLYDVNAGAIKLEGIDLRELDRKVLRQHIGLVSQDVYLFHGTIRENVAYGSPNVSEEAIINAAKEARLHDFIASLPNGYDSLIGEKGIKLSGGQRQRLSIARAILKDAPILILDEATSSVDTETERAIQENLDRLSAGRTTLIIAHRLSTIRHADRIIVLQNGRVLEEGNHDELLKTAGVYADLWSVQIGEAGR